MTRDSREPREGSRGQEHPQQYELLLRGDFSVLRSATNELILVSPLLAATGLVKELSPLSSTLPNGVPASSVFSPCVVTQQHTIVNHFPGVFEKQCRRERSGGGPHRLAAPTTKRLHSHRRIGKEKSSCRHGCHGTTRSVLGGGNWWECPLISDRCASLRRRSTCRNSRGRDRTPHRARFTRFPLRRNTEQKKAQNRRLRWPRLRFQ